MTYQSAQALRTALENRLLAQSTETGASLDRLRRRVMFERIIARIQAAEPGQWVLKGGMALEVRLRDDARPTKDVDLGLRDDVNSAPDLHERLIDILTIDLDHDYFIFTVGPPERLDDSGGFPTWGAKVGAQLADKPFGRVQLDVSPRTHELHATDRLAIPNSLAFAGIPAVEVEAVDIHRHAAEKFHGMLRDFGNARTPESATSSTSPSCSNTVCSYPSERQPQSEPYGSNATTPNHRTTSRRCQSRGRTATSDLQPVRLLTSRPTPQPSPT
jgi:hypothetical protein